METFCLMANKSIEIFSKKFLVYWANALTFMSPLSMIGTIIVSFFFSWLVMKDYANHHTHKWVISLNTFHWAHSEWLWPNRLSTKAKIPSMWNPSQIQVGTLHHFAEQQIGYLTVFLLLGGDTFTSFLCFYMTKYGKIDK